MNSDDKDWLIGKNSISKQSDFGKEVAFQDHKIKYAVKYCRNKTILDLGCVHHNPENYKSKYWLHKALCEVSKSVIGIDIYEPGIIYLREKGYDVRYGNAEHFDLDMKFDVIVAGDVIEHLSNVGMFLECCRRHLHKGGKLIISTPNPWYWRNVVKAAFKARVQPNQEHTLWMCPDTLRQIALRYGFRISDITYGSRYMRDKLMPFPKGIKHPGFHAALDFK